MGRYSNRQRILSEFQKGELFTAADIVKKLPDLDQATVYRNINKLLGEGYIKEVKIKKGTSSYEVRRDNHQHFICNNCERIIPFDFDESSIKKLLRKKGVFISNLEMNVTGLCNNCNN